MEACKAAKPAVEHPRPPKETFYNGRRGTLNMKFLTVMIVVLSLAGVIVSSLALREHYRNEPSPCSINEVWDCGAVNHSPYAVVHGVPVAMIGIVGYALLAVLAGRFPRLAALAALAGMIFALRLTWVEWKILRAWCIYCVSSQAIISLALVLTAAAAWLPARRSSPQPPAESKC